MSSRVDFSDSMDVRRCGLAVALPLTFQDLVDDLQVGATKEYARGIVGIRAPEVAWIQSAAEMAKACVELIDTAAEAGVSVVRAATLANLRDLFVRHSVVTVVAHWRGSTLSGPDILMDPTSLLELLEKRDDEVSTDIAGRLSRSALDRILSVSNEDDQKWQVAEILNREVILSPKPLPGIVDARDGMIEVTDDLTLASEHRRLLDQCLSRCVRPGNRLELRDGLHDREAIAGEIPSDWGGVVDLVNCHSAYLGHAIKAGRPDRRVIIANRKILPDVRLRIQRALYSSMRDTGADYVALLVTLFIELRAIG